MIDQTHDIKVLSCPSCGGTIELMAAGYSTCFVCQYCSSELDLVSDEIKLIAKHAKAAAALILPLGSKGTLFGAEWVAIGCLKKNDGWEAWHEFLLFNPYHGYRWLVLTKDGWSFDTPILSQPELLPGGSCYHEGARMRQCYDFSISSVDAALGEFYWQVRSGDQIRSASYVGGGRMLSCEDAGNEYNWSLAEWVDSSTVAHAFGIEDTGQYPVIGDTPLPHQPNPYAGKTVQSFLVASVFFLLAVLLSIILSVEGTSRAQDFAARIDDSDRTVSVGQFSIDGRPRPFRISTRGSPGDNNWMDVEYTLTNVKTGDEIIANQPIQYYFGRDWKEDDRSGTIKISGVPAGTYELTASVALPEDETGTSRASNTMGWQSQSRPITIEAQSNGVFISNLVLIFLGLFAPVFWVGFRWLSFETKRTSGYDGEDDD